MKSPLNIINWPVRWLTMHSLKILQELFHLLVYLCTCLGIHQKLSQLWLVNNKCRLSHVIQDQTWHDLIWLDRILVISSQRFFIIAMIGKYRWVVLHCIILNFVFRNVYLLDYLPTKARKPTFLLFYPLLEAEKIYSCFFQGH